MGIAIVVIAILMIIAIGIVIKRVKDDMYG